MTCLRYFRRYLIFSYPRTIATTQAILSGPSSFCYSGVGKATKAQQAKQIAAGCLLSKIPRSRMAVSRLFHFPFLLLLIWHAY